ncbi:MAG: hypothetical protein K0Q87_4515 [Neobacillus sp.]|nr:hypothetical protein [Neobacillus sp.]
MGTGCQGYGRGREEFMRSLCKTCGKYWNISILQEIPRTGYECPKCAVKRKGGKRPWLRRIQNQGSHLKHLMK